MKTFKLLFYISFIMIQISCEKPDRSIDIYMDNFPPPSNLEVLIDVAQDYSGDVKITPTAQGVYLFLVDYGDGTNPEQIKPGTSLFRNYKSGTYTIEVIAKSLIGVSISNSQHIKVLNSCIDEEYFNENPDEGPLNFTFKNGNGRFFPIGGAGSKVIENIEFDFENLSCYVSEFERKNNCNSSAGAIKILPTTLNVDQEHKKKFQLDVFALDKTASVTLKLFSTPPIEITQTITETGKWQKLDFELIDLQGKSFNRIIIYFDKGLPCDGSIFYFDNLKYVDYDN